MTVLERIVSYLPTKLQPYAKALIPFVLTLVTIGVQWAVTGEYSHSELATTVTGLVTTFAAYLFPNIPPGEIDPDEPVAVQSAGPVVVQDTGPYDGPVGP